MVEGAAAVDGDITIMIVVVATDSSRPTSLLTTQPQHLQAALMTLTRSVSFLYSLY